MIFQSTLLMRGATRHGDGRDHRAGISIHAPHARSDDTDGFCSKAGQCISIHAPHARSDARSQSLESEKELISIHAPHARSDSSRIASALASGIFQSTLLMRGATIRTARNSTRSSYFNPRSSCEERPDADAARLCRGQDFNPRSSCEERP